ncbi:vesicle coat protein [Lipomyces orientalis]|uniref:Vesicle coat protein n=1 Tax=Lipomyces orientalis TaxID=1233043 RepID=A0ACC3TNN2_9ASCO
MDFLLCLAHFCEIHGPTPIICTQAILDSFPSTTPSARAPPDTVRHEVSAADNSACTSQTDLLSSSSQLPPGNLATHSSNPGGITGTAAGVGGGCLSCSLSLPTESSVSVLRSVEKTIAPPEGTHLVYISTSNARSQDRYSALRQMCMTSLSLDPYTSDTAVLFGDGQIGYAIALYFRIRDEMARGSSRSYALICMNDRESQLQDAWHIIVPALEDIARWIVNEADQARNSKFSGTTSNLSCSNADSTARRPTVALGGITLPGFLEENGSPDRYLRRQYEPKPRNLVDLTGRKDIFVHLHLSFTVILSTLCREIAKSAITSGLSRF